MTWRLWRALPNCWRRSIVSSSKPTTELSTWSRLPRYSRPARGASLINPLLPLWARLLPSMSLPRSMVFPPSRPPHCALRPRIRSCAMESMAPCWRPTATRPTRPSPPTPTMASMASTVWRLCLPLWAQAVWRLAVFLPPRATCVLVRGRMAGLVPSVPLLTVPRFMAVRPTLGRIRQCPLVAT